MTNAESTRSLGRYQLLFMLGQGGMGEVHLAKLTGAAGFEKLCIVKTILPQMNADPQFVDRFHHEARVLVHLNHSNIAQVYDMGDYEGTLYMAIEYVPGVDLARVENRVVRQDAVMPVPIALYLGQQVNEALGYAHRKTGPDGSPLGIVHRDVSPQNVMVSYEGEVKVIDFGLAKSAVRSQHTMPQTVMGKLGYMSPEQAMARPVDHRSDIFSSGIVLWELLAGRPLYGGGTMGEMVAQMANPNVPPLRSVRPDVSATLEQVVMRALATDPAARYSRADDFARALNELAVRESLTVGAEEVGNYVRAMCPEEFAAERQLQSRLSILRRRATTEPNSTPGDETLRESQEELGGTLLRPSQPGVAVEQMTPAQRALSVAMPSAPGQAADPNPGRGRTVVAKKGVGPALASSPSPKPVAPPKGGTVVQKRPPVVAQPVDDSAHGVSEELVVPKSKAPLFVALGLGVLVVGGGAYFALKPGDAPVEPKVVVADPKVDEPAKHPVEPTPAVAEKDAGAEVAEPTKPDPEPAAPAKPAAAELGQVEVVGTPVAVRLEDDEAIVLVPRGQKPPFQEGDSVVLVAMPEGAPKKVPVYARGTVIDVKPTLVKVAVTEGQGPAGVKLFAMKDASAKVGAAVVAKRPATGTAKDPAPAPTKDPAPAKDPVATTKEPATGNPKEPAMDPVNPFAPQPAGQKPPKGTATKPAPTGTATTPTTGTPAPAAAAARQLAGAIGVSNGPRNAGQLVRVQNNSGVPLTNCTVRLNTNRSAKVAGIAANSNVVLRYVDFLPDPRPPDANFAQGWSAVYCQEGTGYFFTTWGR